MGENVKQSNWESYSRFPQTRMGVEQLYIDYFTRAKAYDIKQKSGELFRRDIEMEVLAENLKQRAFKEQKLVDDANKLGKKLHALEIKIKSKVGSGDKLFGSIGNQDLSTAFEQNGHEIEKKFITLPGKTIKRLGAYEATIRLHRKVVVKVAFEIIAE